MQEEEANQLLAFVPEGAVVVVLDERGKALSSLEFANRMSMWRDDGVRDIVFMIAAQMGIMIGSVVG